jgi:hypothetical protein
MDIGNIKDVKPEDMELINGKPCIVTKRSDVDIGEREAKEHIDTIIRFMIWQQWGPKY